MITTLLFDLGGVCLSPCFGYKSRRQLAEHFSLPFPEMEAFYQAHAEAINTGKEDFPDFFAFLQSLQPSLDLQTLVDYTYNLNTANQEMFSLLKQLRIKHPTLTLATLHNESRFLDAYRMDRFHLRDYFTHFFSSHAIGLQKPDPRTFQYVLTHLQVPASQVFFIDDRPENVTAAQSVGMHIILTTNGVISENAAKAILRNRDYLIGIKISLDGYDAASHCAIRRTIGLKKNPAIFERTLQTIYMAKKENLPLTIATVLHSENIQYFDKFVKLIKEINPISWFISPIIPSGRGNTAQEMVKHYNYYKKSFWEKIVDKCTQENINIKLIDMPYDLEHKRRLDYYSCGAAISFCEINADGTVAPCTLCRTIIPKEKMTFENLRETSLQQIWNGGIFNQFRSFMTQGCTGCKAFSKCVKSIARERKTKSI